MIPSDDEPRLLRVGIDVRKFRPVSGQARYVWRLGRWLGARGHPTHLLSVRPQPSGVKAGEGVRLHRLHGLSRAELRRHVADLDLDVLLINPERSRRYRGIRANLLRPGYGTEHYRQKLASFRSRPGRVARKLLRWAPWVLAERRWERGFYEDPDPAPDVIANSRYMRGEILDSYDVPADHVHVVHNGVDLDEFSPSVRARLRPRKRAEWDVPDDAVCMLFLGHNFRLKGLWQMLEVAARLRGESGAPDLRVLVAGSGVGGGQVRKARRKVKRLGLEESVHLLGPVRPAIDALAAADLFVHLSWHDSFGFAVLEAMAAGLPVVTTRFTGASELIEDGQSGVLVHPGDPDDILEGVRRLLDGRTRDAMGAAAASVAAGYSEEQNFQAVLDVMWIAKRRGRGAVR